MHCRSTYVQGRYSQPHFSAAYFSEVRSFKQRGGHVCDQGINGGEGALGNIFSSVVHHLHKLNGYERKEGDERGPDESNLKPTDSLGYEPSPRRTL